MRLSRPRANDRFAICRQRALDGCGGHHERGPVVAGHPIVRWVCCPECPARDEVASARSADKEAPPSCSPS